MGSVDVGLEVEEAVKDFIGVVGDDLVEWAVVFVDGRGVVVVDALNTFVGGFSVWLVDDTAGVVEYETIEFKKRTAVLKNKRDTGDGVSALKQLGRVTLWRVNGRGFLRFPVTVGVTGHEDLRLMVELRLLHDAS